MCPRIAQKVGMETAHIGGTAGTGSHHVVVATEQLVELLCQWHGQLLKACIAHRLAAAGLSLGIVNVET
jgi:hypothetical protein